MKKKIYVEIWEENEQGKVSKTDMEVDSLIDVARVLVTWKSGKGKRVVHVGVDILEVLV